MKWGLGQTVKNSKIEPGKNRTVGVGANIKKLKNKTR